MSAARPAARRRLHLGVLAVVLAGASGRPARAQPSPDTVALRASIVARLAEARTAAGAARSAATRERLLHDVLDAQLEADDLDGMAATTRTIGHDRARAFTRTLCAFAAAGRVDAAEALARTLTDHREQDWALARLAVQRARRPPGRTVDMQPILAAAGTPRSIRPRVDALIAIARLRLQAGDTTSMLGALDVAHDLARTLPDSAERVQRLALVAADYARAGRVERALALAATLPAFAERRVAVILIALAGPQARVPAVRAAVDALARDSVRLADPRARRFLASELAHALHALGDSAAARALEPPPFPTLPGSGTPADSNQWDADGVSEERAITLIARIPDPRGLGIRARAYLALARDRYSYDFGLQRRLMVHARTAARAVRARPGRDELLGRIAGQQFTIGDNAEALETLRDVRDADAVVRAAYELGTSTLDTAGHDEQRRIAAALPLAEARDAVLAQLIARRVGGDGRRPLDLAVERARAEAIASVRHRDVALGAIATGLLTRGDTVAARALWRGLLARGRLADAVAVPSYISRLLAIGDSAVVSSWVAARATAEDRVRAILALVVARQHALDQATRRPRFVSNGPSVCVDMF